MKLGCCYDILVFDAGQLFHKGRDAGAVRVDQGDELIHDLFPVKQVNGHLNDALCTRLSAGAF